LEPKLAGSGDSNETVYLNVPADRLKVDVEKLTVEFKLLSGEEVRIMRMMDRRTLDEYEEEFNLNELRLISSDGRACFEGRQVFAQFRPIKNSGFHFGPEINRFELDYH